MDEFVEIFHCKLYSKEEILEWGLPEKVKQKLGLDENNYFFLATPREESHEGHKHVHLSIFPTKHEVVHILEVEIPSLNPKTLEKILKTVVKYKFDIITTTGTCKKKNECYFGIFFSKPIDASTEVLQSEISKIKDIKDVKISHYTCNGYCEE
jgi:acetolactate synthase regulatory subunit